MINLLIINSAVSLRTKLFSDTPAKIDLASSYDSIVFWIL